MRNLHIWVMIRIYNFLIHFAIVLQPIASVREQQKPCHVGGQYKAGDRRTKEGYLTCALLLSLSQLWELGEFQKGHCVMVTKCSLIVRCWHLNCSSKQLIFFFVWTHPKKRKQAVEDGRQDVEKTLQEGNDVLNEANKLANDISIAVEVSILSSLPEN